MSDEPIWKQRIEKATVNSLAFVDAETGSHVAYDGPFDSCRDGGSIEVIVPIEADNDIHEQTAENLTERTGDIGIVLADGTIEATGSIEAADVLDGELIVRIDDGNVASPPYHPIECATPACPECGSERIRPLTDEIAVCRDCENEWQYGESPGFREGEA